MLAKTKASPFAALRLSSALISALDELKIERPSPVQKKALPVLLETNKHAILASATGSGKTLAFLLPLVQRMKASEAEVGSCALPARPKTLILAPTRELAEQIAGVSKTLSHHAKYRSLLLTGGVKAHQTKALRRPFDILVTTPGRLLDLWKREKLFLGNVTDVVIDEADMLYGSSDFFHEVQAFLPILLNKRSGGARCIFAGATVHTEFADRGRDQTQATIKRIRALLNNAPLEIIESSIGQKHLPKGTVINVLDTNKDDKRIELQRALQNLRKEGKARTLVFCNTVASCRSAAYYLDEHFPNIHVSCLHGEMPVPVREREWQHFKDNFSDDSKDSILVCTDIAARGLDFESAIDHVILCDIPSSLADFVHRCGRTSRGVSTQGQITIICGNTQQEKARKAKVLNLLKHSDEKREERRKGVNPIRATLGQRWLPESAISRKGSRLRQPGKRPQKLKY